MVTQRPSLHYERAGTRAGYAGPGLSARMAADAPLVLVVDDDPDIVRFIAMALGSIGVRTESAFDAVQGFLLSRRDSPALILVDLHMPAGGGLGMLCKIRELPRLKNVPIVVMTVDPEPALPYQARELGANDFLLKPIQVEQLIELAQRYLPAQNRT